MSPPTDRKSYNLCSSSSWLTGLAVGASLWGLLWLALIAGQLGQPHVNNIWVKEAYTLKQRAVSAAGDERKLLIVGGSASMFGVDSSLLESELGLPVVNFGVNAGIGTYALPALAEPHIKSGDVVVLPLEYRLLLWDGKPSYVTLSWALEHPKTLRDWRMVTWLYGIWQLPLQRVWEGYAGIPNNYSNDGPYGPHRLDRQGDQRFSAKSEQSAAQLAYLRQLPPEKYVKTLAASRLGLNLWAKWWHAWRDRGACLLVVPPPLMWHPEYDKPAWRNFFGQVGGRVESVGGFYMGSAADTFFPVEAMFDTNYHLSAEARVEYTSWLAQVVLAADLPCLSGRTDGDGKPLYLSPMP